MKRIATLVTIMISFCVLTFASNAMANTVSISLEGIESSGIKISGFQLFFYEPDDDYGWPVEYDDRVGPPKFGEDFSYEWGANQPYEGEYRGLDTFINTVIITVDEVDYEVDYVRGIAPYDTYFKDWNKLEDGLVLTLSSNNTFFGIDVTDTRNSFYDYEGTDGEVIPFPPLQIAEEWIEGNQTITISAVPIPSTLLLLGTGLMGLMGLRRRKNR